MSPFPQHCWGAQWSLREGWGGHGYCKQPQQVFCNGFGRGYVYVRCVPESPDCTLLSRVVKCVSAYSVVTGLVKIVLEN